MVEFLRGGPAEPEEFWVWPENWVAVQVFASLGTQWARHFDGMSGVSLWYGLRYEVVEPVLRLLAVPRGEWPDTFARVRTLEAAALPLLNAQS